MVEEEKKKGATLGGTGHLQAGFCMEESTTTNGNLSGLERVGGEEDERRMMTIMGFPSFFVSVLGCLSWHGWRGVLRWRETQTFV
jgi:hypothetical protein